MRKEERNVVESFTEYLLCAEMEYLLCAEEWFWGSLTLLVSRSDFGFVHKESESYRDQTCVPGASGESVATKT